MARVLVLSDIHANLEALEACLAAAPPCDEIWNLGDVVGYGASPNEVVERVRGLGMRVIRGNHDKVCCGLEEPVDFNERAAAAVYWTRAALTGEHLAWLRELPAGPLLQEGGRTQLAHGAPQDEDEYLLNAEDAAYTLAEFGRTLNFHGHTHQQGAFVLERGQCYRLLPGFANTGIDTWEMALQPGNLYLINPGSVGQPRDGDQRAAFVTWAPAERLVTFYRVPYDVAVAQGKIRSAGLPEALAARLELGR